MTQANSTSINFESSLFSNFVPENISEPNNVMEQKSHYLPDEMCLVPMPGPRLLEIYNRAINLNDPFELRDLFLGRIEAELNFKDKKLHLEEKWRSSKIHRSVDENFVLHSNVTARFIKELFNWFFSKDLYGRFKSDQNIIFSSGSVDQTVFGISSVLKECIQYALSRDWYGYSDSIGREATRDSIAALENARIGIEAYTRDNTVITIGGTFAINSIVDFLKLNQESKASPVLCGIPNYPPLVEAVSRRFPLSLVPLPCYKGRTNLRPLIESLRPSTPFVLLQTVTNPTGTKVSETELETLIEAASPNTFIILDECHECFGLSESISPARLNSNVVRVSSLSKNLSAPGLKLGWFLADESFVRSYYEYASTSYGSPPSLFYLFVEVMARMECWRLKKIEVLSLTQLKEFENAYNLQLDSLQKVYENYKKHQNIREQNLINCRQEMVQRTVKAKVDLIEPVYSLNVLLSPSSCNDDYLYFRKVLSETKVSLYPGILSFCLSGNWIRVSPCIAKKNFDEAISRLEIYWHKSATNLL